MRRKLAGNLLPSACGLAAAALAFAARRGDISDPAPLLGFVLGAWLGANWLGLYRNRAMKAELALKLKPEGDAVFVGFATPDQGGLLDPHGDLGFLEFGKHELIVKGETHRLSILRRELSRVRFAPNVHTLIGLGRWLVLEGRVAGKRVRIRLEPRQEATLLGNLLYSSALRRRVEAWQKAPEPRGARGSDEEQGT